MGELGTNQGGGTKGPIGGKKTNGLPPQGWAPYRWGENVWDVRGDDINEAIQTTKKNGRVVPPVEGWR